MVVGNGKIDGQKTLRRNAHAADDDVELAGKQCRNDAVPVGRHELQFDAEIGGQPFRHVDFKTDVPAFLVLHGPGDEGRKTDAQRTALHDLFDDGFTRSRIACTRQTERQSESQEKGGNEMFHECSFRSRSRAGMLTSDVRTR